MVPKGIMSKVNKTGVCWEWTGCVGKDGYGHTSLKSVAMSAHRASWIRHNGPIPDGLCVLHRCDNRKCVRPDHLFLGTHKDNSEDMVAKGRWGGGKMLGETNGRAVLTTPLVKKIKLLARRGLKKVIISRILSVSYYHVNNVLSGKAWKQVTLDLETPIANT